MRVAGPNPNTAYTRSSALTSRSNVFVSKSGCTSIRRPPGSTTASPKVASCCVGDLLAANSTFTNRPAEETGLRLLFQSRFFRWRSSVLKLKPRLRQNSLRRIPLLVNSATHLIQLCDLHLKQMHTEPERESTCSGQDSTPGKNDRPVVQGKGRARQRVRSRMDQKGRRQGPRATWLASSPASGVTYIGRRPNLEGSLPRSTTLYSRALPICENSFKGNSRLSALQHWSLYTCFFRHSVFLS
jgi:hypothetical protein